MAQRPKDSGTPNANNSRMSSISRSPISGIGIVTGILWDNKNGAVYFPLL
jgi:hypothetical protein